MRNSEFGLGAVIKFSWAMGQHIKIYSLSLSVGSITTGCGVRLTGMLLVSSLIKMSPPPHVMGTVLTSCISWV